MKKSFKIIACLALVATAFIGCKRTEQPAPEANKITLNFAAETVDPAAGKATLTPNAEETTFAAAWENNDQIGIYALVGDDLTETQNAVGTWSGSSFSAEIAGTPGADGIFSAAYPYSETGDIDFGSARTQVGNAYNSKYDVMYADGIEAPLSDDATVILPMTRQTAIAYFHFTGTPAEGETIQSATLSVEGANIAGSFAYDDSGIISDGTENSITITFAEGNRPSADDFTLWFNVLPVSYKTLKLEVATENYTLTINNTTEGIYEAGNLYKVSAAVPAAKWVAKSSPVSSGYVLVSNINDITAGKYIIAAKVGDDYYTSDFKTFSSGKSAGTQVDVSDGMISIEDGSNYELTFTANEDGWSINNGTKYLYYSSSTNIGVQTTAYKWTIETGKNGSFRLNSSTSGRACIYRDGTGFGGYSTTNATSTSTEYYDIELFKYVGATVAVTGVTVAPATVSIEEGTITTLTATVAPDDATDKSVTWESDDTSVATVDGNGLVTAIAAGTTTITATTADGGHTATCEVTVYAQVINEVSIAEFLAAEVGGTEWYKLTGEITNIANIKYGNFTIQDATGSVYVYGLASAKGSDVVAFSDHTINEGDIITFIGKRGVHEGTQGEEDEVVDAYYVSHTPAPSISLNPTSVVFAANGGNEEITVTTENFSGDVTITASSNNPQFTTSINGNKVTISANANTTSDNIPGEVTITATANEVSKSATVSVTQNKPVAAAEDGTTLWSESFAGFKAEDVPAFSNNETIVYGGGSVAYSCINGSSDTKIYTGTMSAGGTSPELLVSKSNGSFTVSGLPTGNASVMTLTYKTNNKCAITSNSNITIQELSYSEKVVTALITAENGVATFDLVFTNNASSNSRVDDFLLVAGFEKFNPEITGTDKNLTLGNTLDVSTMFSSDSDGAFTYEIIGDNATDATISSEDHVTFSTSKNGTYTIRATQSATDIYNEGTAEATITVSAQSTKGTVRITRDCFPSGSLAYNVTDSWSATASTGETVTGEGDLYSTVNQTTLQSKNSGVSTMYHNTVAIPGNITKITLKCASGSTRTYTAYMNKTTAITSTSGGTSKGTIAPTAGNTASLAFNKEDGWRYFWLNLAGGASYLDYIEIEYEK